MQFEIYTADTANAIKTLVTNVFTDSEGETEGQLIGNLAFELQATTKPEDFFGFVAKDDDKIVGCVFFTRLTFDTPINAFILSPMAVATDYQNQGIGKDLIRFGVKHLKQQPIELLFTYGDPSFYSKVGFAPISEKVAAAPLKLSYPHGWLAQSLLGETMTPISGDSSCVPALNHQHYW